MADEPEPKKRARKTAKPKPGKGGAKPAAPTVAEPAPATPAIPVKKAAKKPKARAKPKPAAPPAKAPRGPRDIGIDVPLPTGTCTDAHCPFHGSLRVRGQMIDGVVVSAAMTRTVVVERARLHYVPKYERFEKRTRRVPAHAPPCLALTLGSRVTLMECRPLSKTVSLVAIHNRGAVG